MLAQAMNLILFSEGELQAPLPRGDERAVHILEVLRRTRGDSFDAGIIDGRIGKARVAEMTEAALVLAFEPDGEPPPLYPVRLVIGLSRPQAMRRVLRDCTSLGVSRLSFFGSDRGEPSYAESSLWKAGEFRRHLVDGAQQAFSTRLPAVELHPSLAACLSGVRGDCVALDNYEASRSLGAFLRSERPRAGDAVREPIALVVGSERGWSPDERLSLRSAGVPLLHLGARVLRTEVACISATSIVLSALGFYDRLLADAEAREHRVEDVG